MRLIQLLALSLLPLGIHAADIAANQVVVVANADDPGSLDVARHYLKERKIPKANLIALKLPREEAVDWNTFVSRIHNPLLARLREQGWLSGDVDKTDAEGRDRLKLTENRVAFLVLCRGVPLKITNDPQRLPAEDNAGAIPAALRVNHASVDAELALLPGPETPTVGFVPNPWYGEPAADAAEKRAATLRVARLDGPTVRDAKLMVDHAIEAENEGLTGRAYIDLGGPHAKGDAMLRRCAELCESLGYETDVDTAPGLMPLGARFDAPVLYFGWYAANVNGVFKTPGFRFPPGAVAIHIHSFSAKTLRSPETHWAGPLIARGVTATVGNVEEPYLEFTHNPSIFLDCLLKGETAGEAAAKSIPVLSWQGVFFGDPLYRPFHRDLERQMRDIDDKPVDERRAYAVLRTAKLLEAKDERKEARELLEKSFTLMPVLPLARAMLERDLRDGKKPAFRTELLAPVEEDPGLVLSTAEKLFDAVQHEEAGKLLAFGVEHNRALAPAAADLARRKGYASIADKILPPAPATPSR